LRFREISGTTETATANEMREQRDQRKDIEEEEDLCSTSGYCSLSRHWEE
jgi:post-segregation antitoxin (ccd killing protein)